MSRWLSWTGPLESSYFPLLRSREISFPFLLWKFCPAYGCFLARVACLSKQSDPNHRALQPEEVPSWNGREAFVYSCKTNNEEKANGLVSRRFEIIFLNWLSIVLISEIAYFCCLYSSRTPRSFSTAWTPWADKFLTCGLDANLAVILSVAIRERAMNIVIVFLSLVIRLLAIEYYEKMIEWNNARLIVSCDVSKLLGSSKLHAIMNEREWIITQRVPWTKMKIL